MPARRKPKMHIRADAFRASQEREAAAQRKLCSHLLFWKACGHKKCLRARACVVDGRECFDRFWPLVPEEIKISIRTEIKTAKARLSPAETKAVIEREIARWRATMAPREVPQAAAEPAPQSPPIVRAAPSPCAPSPRAPSPRAPSPRLRVL
jgi:hypothetical protein